MPEDARTPTPEQTLAWEAERRRTAGLSAAGAALLTIAGSLTTGLALSAVPSFDDRTLTVLDTLGRAAEGQPIPPGRLAAQTAYLGDHAAVPIVGTLLFVLGTLLIFPAMAYLFRATRARRPGFQQLALVLLAVGIVAFGVGRGVAELARYLGAASFEGGTNADAADALASGPFLVGNLLWTAGGLALGFAFVLICINAMRAGLLTRFTGILGVIVGATFVLPLDQQGIIRVFWLGALSALILGRWPRGVPAAWTTGEAVPWPSQQELRERREAARAGTGGEQNERPQRAERVPESAPREPRRPPPAPRPQPVAARPHPSSKKRKRKRRA
jgi:hypothetical protein